jgi:AcrR family transcriptional regulator
VSDGTADRSGGQVSRRAEYAEATRQAIVDASRRLFAEKGFFATKVDDIARAARVAPATVYAVAGGKQGLLRTLMDIWTTAPIVAANLERIGKLDDPVTILRTIAMVTREMRQEFGDIMRVMIATAPHDQAVAESLKTATSRYRAGNAFAGRRLAELGALRAGLDAQAADDILWFYFGYAGLFTLVDDNGWTYPQAEEWLVEAASRALFRQRG